MKDREFSDFKNKVLIVFLVAVVVCILIFVLFTKGVNPLNRKMKKEDTLVIFVTGEKCDNCSKIKSFLDSKNVDYLEYDENNYALKNILEEYDFNLEESITPSVLYISKGKLYSSLVNINTTDELELFINNYKLSK